MTIPTPSGDEAEVRSVRFANVPADLTQIIEWQVEGTALIERLVRTMGPEEFREISALDGWTRQHLIAHLARNADALSNLLYWARTGEETPMYVDSESRELGIRRGAEVPASVAVENLMQADRNYEAAIEELQQEAWSEPVRTAQGRVVTAAVVPWLRVRELWVHAADLQLGFAFTGLPESLGTALLDDAVDGMNRRGEAPHTVLRLADDDQEWEIVGAGRPVVVSGPLDGLLEYVMRNRAGKALRVIGGASEVPDIPRWL